jgi:hypothetical protein
MAVRVGVEGVKMWYLYCERLNVEKYILKGI